MSLERKLGLRDNEKIISLIYHSWWTQFSWFLLSLFFILVPAYFSFWLFSQGLFGILSFSISEFVGLLLILKIFVNHFKNFTVLTEQRLVNFRSQGLFDEEIVSINIYEVQNILYSRKSFLANLLNYGDLSLENNQRQELLFLSKIKKPEKIFHLLNRVKDNFWLKEKNLNTDEIIDLFINNVSSIRTEDLVEIKEYLEEILANR